MPKKYTPPKSNRFPLLQFLSVVLSVCVLIGFLAFLPYANRTFDPVINPYSLQGVSAFPMAVAPVTSGPGAVAPIPSSDLSVEIPVSPPEVTKVESGTVEPSTAQSESPQLPKDPVPIHVPILLYHYVRDTVYSRDIARYEMNVTPAIFEDQLKALIGDGYHFVTMAQVSEALDGAGTLPEKPIVLTFDDGIVDVYTNVLPLLKLYQVSITAYLVPALLDHKQHLTSDMAATLASSGWVEIGSHSTHHLKLNTLSDAKAKAEIVESKAFLEKLFGVQVSTFAYPFGLYGEIHPKLVKEAGYTSAASMIWTVARNSADKFLLPRLNVGQKSGAALVAFLRGFK